MKRRTFLTATGTIGLVSAASSSTVVSSVYSDYSTQILLEEFNTVSKTAVDNFVSDIKANAEAIGLDGSFAKKLAMPVRILNNETVKGNQNIVYKNKSGNTISITSVKGKCTLRIVTA